MKQNGVVCEPGPLHLFFIFRFEYLISGPKSYRDVRETGPWPEVRLLFSLYRDREQLFKDKNTKMTLWK